MTECQDASLVWMANGIWNCSADMMMGFDPELGALRKSTTVLPDKESSESVHVKPDGTPITFWQWIDSLVPYEGGRELLAKLAGATLRNRVNWRCMVTLYNKTGQTARARSSTICMLKQEVRVRNDVELENFIPRPEVTVYQVEVADGYVVCKHHAAYLPCQVLIGLDVVRVVHEKPPFFMRTREPSGDFFTKEMITTVKRLP